MSSRGGSDWYQDQRGSSSSFSESDFNATHFNLSDSSSRGNAARSGAGDSQKGTSRIFASVGDGDKTPSAAKYGSFSGPGADLANSGSCGLSDYVAPPTPQLPLEDVPMTITQPVPFAAVPPPIPTQPPRRHRFDFLTAVGELLIVLGCLSGLFAFWDVFVTDWQVGKYNTQATVQFQESAPQCINRVSDQIRTDDPPAAQLVSTGEVMGLLHFPTWNYQVVPVREGTDQQILDTGSAGHYAETALPGQIGNFSVAAHRRSYGSNFRRVDQLQIGDAVVMETADAWLVYQVESTEIVTPDQGDVILPVPGDPDAQPTERLMTMTTCHPEYGNWERFIVHLKLSHWVPRDSGIPEELAAGGNVCSE